MPELTKRETKLHCCYYTIFHTMGLRDSFRIAADDTYRKPRYLKCHKYVPARYRKYRSFRHESVWTSMAQLDMYRFGRYKSILHFDMNRFGRYKIMLRFDICRNKRSRKVSYVSTGTILKVSFISTRVVFARYKKHPAFRYMSKETVRKVSICIYRDDSESIVV